METGSAAVLGRTMEEWCFDAMFEGTSLQSLLSMGCEDKPPYPLLDYALGDSQLALPAYYSSFADCPPTSDGKLVGEGFGGQDQQLRDAGLVGDKLKMPKVEPVAEAVTVSDSREQFKYEYNLSGSIPEFSDSGFLHLPGLHSLECVTNVEKDRVSNNFSLGESSHKRDPTFFLESDSYTLDAIVRSFRLPNCLNQCRSGDGQRRKMPVVCQRGQAMRHKRRSISDKARCLQKLLPTDKKMDMATMLEDACKYIKFLEAQIRVLQFMPHDNASFTLRNPASFGCLGRLNRQQVLQVVVNSPVAQTIMYSKGCCLFSVEQLQWLTEMAKRRVHMQCALVDPSGLC